MTSFDLSQSYHRTHDDSLATFQLLTSSGQLSLIQEIYSQSSANMSPQVLFSPQFKNKRHQPEVSFRQKSGQKSDINLLDNLLGFDELENQPHTCESIQICENESGVLKLQCESFMLSTDSNKPSQQQLYSQTRPILFSKQLYSNRVPIHFTVSRHIQPAQPLFDSTQQRQGLHYFEHQFECLKQNVERLRKAIDQVSTSDSSNSSPLRELYIPVNRALNYETGKKIKIHDKLQAKSTESHDMMTPPKYTTQIGQFSIQDLSPIHNISARRSSNTDESSSRLLMFKKLNRVRLQSTV